MDLESEDNALIAGGASVTAMEEDAAIRSSIPNDQQRAEETDDTPALFVTTMPQDIWANPSLGALAALIDESNEEQMNGANGSQSEGGHPSTAGHDRNTGTAVVADAAADDDSLEFTNSENDAAAQTLQAARMHHPTTIAQDDNKGRQQQQEHAPLATPDETGTTINPLYQHEHQHPPQHHHPSNSSGVTVNTNLFRIGEEVTTNIGIAGGATTGRHSRHRDAVRQRRSERRAVASPCGGISRSSSQQGRGRGREGTAGIKGRGREGPTSGEMQVLMSLLGI